MKFTKIIRNKEVVQYLSVFVTLLLIIGIQFFSGSIENKNISDLEFAENLVAQSETINVASKFFITLKPALNLMVNYNNVEAIKNIAILFAESIGIYFIVCILISKTYIKAVTELTSLGNKKGRKINQSKDFSKNSLWKSYVKKEFKILVRNPIFFMQCVLPSVLFPFIFSIPLIMAYKDSSEEVMNLQILSKDINTSVGFGFSLVIICFLYIFNFIALTAISRDGKDAVFIKQIPVSIDKQIFYKILPGIILNVIPTIYVLVFEKILVPQLELKTIIILFAISTICNIFNNYLMILIDLKNPKLNWTTEYAVVKQNFNMIFQFVIFAIQCVMIIGICGYFKLYEAEIVLFALFSVGTILVRKYIRTKQIKIFSKIN